MKKSYLVIATIIGIFAVGIFAMLYYQQVYTQNCKNEGGSMTGMLQCSMTFPFCEKGFVPYGDKCVPDPKVIKEISVDALADNLCSNHILGQNETGTFLTCLHMDSDSKETIFDLPPPIYMLKLCPSMHGCMYPYMWVPQIPPNLISEGQKQQAIDKALALPQTKNWPSEPKLDQFLIIPSQDRWDANIQFFIAGIKMPQHNKCEYYDSVNMDLETLEILSGFRDFNDFEECKNQ